jgi:hypothetical protein
MRRAIVMVVAAVLLVAALMGTAAADVHAVSQAGCGNSASAGATESRDAGGRPIAPIPATASDGRTQGQGGAADAQGPHC